jgi:hypothetical protein
MHHLLLSTPSFDGALPLALGFRRRNPRVQIESQKYFFFRRNRPIIATECVPRASKSRASRRVSGRVVWPSSRPAETGRRRASRWRLLLKRNGLRCGRRVTSDKKTLASRGPWDISQTPSCSIPSHLPTDPRFLPLQLPDSASSCPGSSSAGHFPTAITFLLRSLAGFNHFRDWFVSQRLRATVLTALPASLLSPVSLSSSTQN